MTYFRAGEMNLFQSQLRAFKLHRKAALAWALAVWCCLLMGLSSAKAGPVFGDVHGVTVNALGAPVPGVQVSAHSLEDNTDRDIVSDHYGTFVIENLRPGRYQLRAAKGVLASSSVTTIDLAPRQDLRVDMTLVPHDGTTEAANPNLTANLHAPAVTGNSGDAPLTDRERLLLERLDRLEQRLAAMEAKEAKAAAPVAAPVTSQAGTSVTTVPATQPAPSARTSAASTSTPAQPAPAASQAKAGAATVAETRPAPVTAASPGRLDCRAR